MVCKSHDDGAGQPWPRNAYVLIEGDRIAAVGRDLAVAEGSARVVDAANHFIAGRKVTKDGRLVGAGVARLHSEVSDAAAALLERCGITPGWAPPTPGNAVYLAET